ncbi:hypothetical protein HMPREF0063_11359 [Aeromicrobium marinum DSM 15272]|uniref:DUF3140 domain-containing protein n=1 Tax=Aeromicrobium marinum DSM 15272 TaxID=585531 RepID=E2SBF0_9ACTN|nr:DUF3140 domain-containing protein [Aeromicrobium marinum]EFQ83696.1 hypothetical protein HMPREF0063_11359 [Aeromicrobium marinum DSM 15272]
MAHHIVDDDLWDSFHAAVNMTSRELSEWLRTDAAGESAEDLPDRAGDPVGRQVVSVLAKRRTDLTDEDVDVMRHVVEVVRTERPGDLEPEAGDHRWRHRLMSLGHDPLQPPRGHATTGEEL